MYPANYTKWILIHMETSFEWTILRLGARLLQFLIFINDIDAAAGLVKYLNKFADATKLSHHAN